MHADLLAHFGVQGRVSRVTYWRTQLALVGMSLCTGGVDYLELRHFGAPELAVLWFLMGLAATLWLSHPVCIRRLHDLGRSRRWVLAAWIPVVGLVFLVYLGAAPSRPSAEPA